MMLITTCHFGILWTDDAHFNLNDNVNTKNCVYRADTNPHAVASVFLFDAKVTVWCDISGIVLLGPRFFEKTTPKTFVTCSVTPLVVQLFCKIMPY